MLKMLLKFKDNKSGVTAIEYGLIAGFVSVAIIGILGFMRTDMVNLFTAIQTALHGAATPAP